MSKNAFAKQIQTAIEKDRLATRRITRQMNLDLTHIALSRMGFGEKRQHDFQQMFVEVYGEYADLFNADIRDDPEITYAKARLDRELAEYCGEHFVDWDERYYT